MIGSFKQFCFLKAFGGLMTVVPDILGIILRNGHDHRHPGVGVHPVYIVDIKLKDVAVGFYTTVLRNVVCL